MDMTIVILVVCVVLAALALWLTSFFRGPQFLVIAGIFFFTDHYLANPEGSPVSVEMLRVMNTYIAWWFGFLVVGFILELIVSVFRGTWDGIANGGGYSNSGEYNDDSAPRQRRQTMKYTLYWRNSGGYEYKGMTMDSAATVIWHAKNKIDSDIRSNRHHFYRVTDSNGSTIWTGQS